METKKIVDITDKRLLRRTCISVGELRLRKNTIEQIRSGMVKKGDVFETAKIAGIQSIKKTSDLIPLCHQIPITDIKFEFSFSDSDNKVICKCEVSATYKTGVEMESLVGVSVALLTVWDMVKYLEKDANGQYPFTKIENIHVISKTKG